MEETVDEAFARVRVQEPALAFYAAALVAEHWADDRFMAPDVDLAGADDETITRMHNEFVIDALLELGERDMALMFRDKRAEYEDQLAIGEKSWDGLLPGRTMH